MDTTSFFFFRLFSIVEKTIHESKTEKKRTLGEELVARFAPEGKPRLISDHLERIEKKEAAAFAAKRRDSNEKKKSSHRESGAEKNSDLYSNSLQINFLSLYCSPHPHLKASTPHPHQQQHWSPSSSPCSLPPPSCSPRRPPPSAPRAGATATPRRRRRACRPR